AEAGRRCRYRSPACQPCPPICGAPCVALPEPPPLPVEPEKWYRYYCIKNQLVRQADAHDTAQQAHDRANAEGYTQAIACPPPGPTPAPPEYRGAMNGTYAVCQGKDDDHVNNKPCQSYPPLAPVPPATPGR